jgi:hypothetical protein
MALPMSRALAIKAMGISARDSKAQWGQVTGTMRMGSGISFPLALIHCTDYRRGMGLWVDKEVQRSLKLLLIDELGEEPLMGKGLRGCHAVFLANRGSCVLFAELTP